MKQQALRNVVEIDSEFLVRDFVRSLGFESSRNVDILRFSKCKLRAKYPLKILNLFFQGSLDTKSSVTQGRNIKCEKNKLFPSF